MLPTQILHSASKDVAKFKYIYQNLNYEKREKYPKYGLIEN